MNTLYITICILYLSTTESRYKDVEDILSLLKINNSNNGTQIRPIARRHFGQNTDNTNNKVDDNNKNLPVKSDKDETENIHPWNDEANYATTHPWLSRKYINHVPYRRQYKYKDVGTEETERESSTSAEMQRWKEDFDLDWVNKKMAAIKDKVNTSGSITIKMANGRPWGVPCGDPNQHDLPWGTCVLPYECDGEFRIFRGDALCGRNNFVCCALQVTQHDLYQALDMSFIDTSLSTSSNEKRKSKQGSKEIKRKKKLREVYRRRRRRFRLKRTIKKLIRKLARQIRKALNRAFRNATGDRRHKTKLLKNQIKKMKQKFYLDRKVAKNIHDYDVQKIDNDLKYKLKHVRDLNHNFLMNDTYRNMILGHNRTKLRVLLESYPELQGLILKNNNTIMRVDDKNPTRRSGGRVVHRKKKRKINDYLEYDIEYGALYY